MSNPKKNKGLFFLDADGEIVTDLNNPSSLGVLQSLKENTGKKIQLTKEENTINVSNKPIEIVDEKLLPESVDWRYVKDPNGKQVLLGYRDQGIIFFQSFLTFKGGCGSCYALCASHMLSDRLSIATKGFLEKLISFNKKNRWKKTLFVTSRYYKLWRKICQPNFK